MGRKFALVAVWALFAAAAVGVGFGAAGLVGDPFRDGLSSTTPGSGRVSLPETPTGSPTSNPTQPAGQDAQETRSIDTRAGLITATCRVDGVRLAVSPDIGWEIEDIDPAGAVGRVRFERAGDGEGEVRVRTVCVDGSPRFALDDDAEDRDEGRHGEDEGERGD